MTMNSKALARLEEEINCDIERGDYDGVNLIVARHGEIALQGTYGYAERATQRPTKRDAVYRILSMSKAITNTLAYRALSEGKLELSTSVVAIIPEFISTEPFRAVRADNTHLAH